MSLIGAKGEKMYSRQGFFKYNSAMTFTVYLENRFKVTTHPLLKSSAYVKSEPYRG
jgi:hypothetical protein